MFASVILAQALLLPIALTTSPTRDCQLDRLTTTAIDRQALADFNHAAHEYSALHRRLERALMLDHVAWPDEEDMGTEVLAEVIRAARPSASEGALFTPEVSALLRFRLERTAWLYKYDMADAIPLPAAASVEPPSVHEWWLFEHDAGTWPSLLWELPLLPDELAYRFHGRHLVLVDVHANMVVDVLRNALPEP
jgi:hypothetical protein